MNKTRKIIFTEKALYKNEQKVYLQKLKRQITTENLQQVDIGEFSDEKIITFRIRR